MKMQPGNFCPLIRKECVGLKCAWYCQIRGMNPNTGEDVDEWACAISWLPILQIETSQQSRSNAAATESFRNEVVKAEHENQRLANQLIDNVGNLNKSIDKAYVKNITSGYIPTTVSDVTNTNLLEGGTRE